MKTRRGSLTLGLIGFVVGVLSAATAEASISRDLPRSALSIKAAEDPFATAPQLALPSLTQELKVIDDRLTAASGCVALCDLADAIEVRAFVRVALVPRNRAEGYTGHYWDKESSLYYAKARYYDPFTARFTQSDSFLGNIDDPPSLHRYFYAHANPTFYTDPTGNYSWSDLKGDAGWYRDAAGAFGRDISENAGNRLGNIGRATVEQAKALPGAVVDGAQETLARVHDVGVLASGSGGPLLSNVGQRSSDVLAGGGSLADLTQTIGSEQGKFAGELIANIYTGGGYNVAKESYLALQGTAAQAETRLNQAAGSAVLAATIGGAVKAAPVVVAEARSAIASGRSAVASAAANVSPLLNSRFSLAPIRPGVMMSDPFGLQSTFGRIRLTPPTNTALVEMQGRLSRLVDRQGAVVDRWLAQSQNRWANLYRATAETSPNFAKGIRGRVLDVRMRGKFREMFGDTPGVRIDQTIPGSGSPLRPDLYFRNLGGSSAIFDVGGPSKVLGISKYQGLANELVPLVPRQWF